MNVVPETFVMVQPWCVQMAVRTEKASCEMRATRKVPEADCTSAVPPTAARGEPAVIGTLTVRPETEPFNVGRAEPPPPPLGDVELPPQPSTRLPTVRAVTV